MCSPFELTALLFWKPNHCELKVVNERDMMINELMRGKKKQTQKKNYKQSFAISVSQEYKIFFMHRLSCSRSSIHRYGNQNGSGDILEAELSFTA